MTQNDQQALYYHKSLQKLQFKYKISPFSNFKNLKAESKRCYFKMGKPISWV